MEVGQNVSLRLEGYLHQIHSESCGSVTNTDRQSCILGTRTNFRGWTARYLGHRSIFGTYVNIRQPAVDRFPAICDQMTKNLTHDDVDSSVTSDCAFTTCTMDSTSPVPATPCSCPQPQFPSTLPCLKRFGSKPTADNH